METVLIIEDDPTMLRGLKDNFEFEGYRVLGAAEGERGFAMALESRPDLIVLDLMLPKMNGYEICQRLRKLGHEMPILMLTAKAQESDVVLGLGVGADDYVKKPFSIREVLARAEALLRRCRKAELDRYRFGACELDFVGHRLLRDGAEVKLSPKEFELLKFLVKRPGRAWSRDEILNAVWGYDQMVTQRSVDRFITGPRQKIEPTPDDPRYIVTIREFGYKFVEPTGSKT